ncbi:viral A-type inclusion protein [Reticulomyxa filosa]|uniref:Viral A-type inclusion protein n=1 Tax=Reticulomyxa filosa TaxID=46433 RepID=X6P6Z9_RETFI|nr:viral A-type inclusion protein [Reticulomyxa filosa]|eukprot:ETO33971.1 viral A-type inclusion protein [Reticulomyxa filosa]
MIWACFGAKGVGNDCKIEGGMNYEIYKEVLEDYMLKNFQQIINIIIVQERNTKTTNKQIVKLLQKDICKKDTEIGELKTNVKELESKQEELQKLLTDANSTISLNDISSPDSEKILFSDEKLKLTSLQSQITDVVDKLKISNLELDNKIEELKTENTNMETIIGIIETIINTGNDITPKVKKRNLNSTFDQDLDIGKQKKIKIKIKI